MSIIIILEQTIPNLRSDKPQNFDTCMSDSQRLIGPFWNLEVDFITGIQV